MGFAFNSKHPQWSTKQQLFILAKITEGLLQQDIYDALIAESSDLRPAEVERWEGPFSTFRHRVTRMNRHGIDPALDLDNGCKYEFNLGTTRGRYDYWIWLAKTTSNLSMRVAALQQIEKLAPQFADKSEEEDDGMTPAERKARGEFLLTDWHAFSHVVANELAEHIAKDNAAGVIDLLSDVLNASTTTRQVRYDVIMRVLEQHPMHVANETQEQKLERLRIEILALSKDEMAALERAGEEANDDNEGDR